MEQAVNFDSIFVAKMACFSFSVLVLAVNCCMSASVYVRLALQFSFLLRIGALFASRSYQADQCQSLTVWVYGVGSSSSLCYRDNKLVLR
jgi:hypothetical protein